MRRLTEVILLSLLSFAFGFTNVACRRQPSKAPAEATDEGSQKLLPMVHVADPRSSVQLLKGFYDVEQGSWRWTKQNFSVMLRPPAGAVQKGATLQLKFSVPDPVIERLKSVTLSANVAGVALPSETYTKPGEYVYTRDVPAAALAGEAVTAAFSLDKALPPGEADQRELGVVVSSAGLETK